MILYSLEGFIREFSDLLKEKRRYISIFHDYKND